MYTRKQKRRGIAARILTAVLTAALLLGAMPAALAAPSAGLTDFTETDTVHVDRAAGTVTVGNTHGDHFAVYEGQEQKSNDFVLEADVDLVSGGYDANRESRCAGLIFGVASRNMPSRQWRCVNTDAGRTTNEDGSIRGDGFRAFGPGIVETTEGGELTGIDAGKTLHFKLDMQANGEFAYTFGNVGGEMRTIRAKVEGWAGGYVGIMSFCTEARFSNIQFEDRTDRGAAEASAVAAADSFASDLGDLTAYGGTWEIRGDGLYSSAVDQGNCWALSQKTGSNFVFSTDVSDYRYTPAVYNNFPWPTPTDQQKAKIEQTAQAILDARAIYPDSSLADLYDETTMPPELRKAHQMNDKAVMLAYGFSVKDMTESKCVAELMRMYQALTT